MSGERSSGPSRGSVWLPPERNEATPLTGGTPRFGALSHHSFFSRHNPHPHRVRHIQGLNGRPVCMVKDDWLVTSSLFPHPLLKSYVQRQAGVPSLANMPHQTHYGFNSSKSAMFSEAWRDELKELAAKVSLASQKDKKQAQPTDEPTRRETQYSAQTGRLIPPSAKSQTRRPYSQRLDQQKPLHDQELMVLELLCQILQTDSLWAVQRWLLLAGHREKELVMRMIKQVDFAGRRPSNLECLQAYDPLSSRPHWRTQQRAESNGTSSFDKPETIGDAEILQIHTETEQDAQDKLSRCLT
ncbi:protein TBATA [Corythoichthys intestinalis]|uniref:protein TBATA n=1 Tax=Corythoichthys intestinalis TaxID=161448 RepID=UPI0025A628D0|nr:protein TBATA [Corythoichthys intestinalis]